MFLTISLTVRIVELHDLKSHKEMLYLIRRNSMSPCPPRYLQRASAALTLSMLIGLSVLMSAQTEPAPAPKKSAAMSAEDSYPKAELFVGYQWLNPGGDIPTI